MRWRSAGQYACPVIVRAPYGGGIQRRALPLAESRGVLLPHRRPHGRDPVDAARTRRACCSRRSQGEDPVIFLEPKRLYRTRQGRRAPRALHGAARVRRASRAHGDARAPCSRTARWCRCRVEAARAGRGERLVGRGRSTCARWYRSIAEAVLASVQKTGRVVIVHEAPRTCGYGAELVGAHRRAARSRRSRRRSLRVTGYDTPFPYTLEHTYLPDPPRVLRAIEHVMSVLTEGERSRMPFEVKLPDIGEGVAEGEIVRWLVKIGDRGARGPAARRGDDRQGERRDPVAAHRT